MKTLLTTTAVALIAMSGVASAQSVLERVLTNISTDNSNMLPVTGTFANIAENIAVLHNVEPVAAVEAGWTQGGTAVTTTELQTAYEADRVTARDAYYAANPITFTDPDVGPWYIGGDITTPYLSQLDAEDARSDQFYVDVWTYTDYTDWAPLNGYTYNEAVAAVPGSTELLNAINGSISNTMSGIADATAAVGTDVLAYNEVQVDIGDLSTTVLGAVNTGDITLGVNQNVSEAISGTSSAVSASINQLGGISGQTALVLNVASNATDVVGSVTNSFSSLNGSIGNVATTVLGAVNTGTITSGINAAVNGVQSGIVGN